MNKLLFFALLISLLFVFVNVQAKRGPAPEVEPVIHSGVKYTAPHNKMGYIEAYDIKTGKKIWEKKVYDVKIDFRIEADVQWIFIKELKIDSERLVVIDERAREYIVDILNIKER